MGAADLARLLLDSDHHGGTVIAGHDQLRSTDRDRTPESVEQHDAHGSNLRHAPEERLDSLGSLLRLAKSRDRVLTADAERFLIGDGEGRCLASATTTTTDWALT